MDVDPVKQTAEYSTMLSIAEAKLYAALSIMLPAEQVLGLIGTINNRRGWGRPKLTLVCV